MSEEREMALLSEIRDMLAMDLSTIAEKYHVGIDNADDYRTTKAMAVLDCVIDNLNELILAKNTQAHYKGIAKE